MKRKRICAAVGKKNWKAEKDEEIQRTVASILDVPDRIFKDILLRLPIKGIIMCKCVCKTWRSKISDPLFAKTHFANASPCPLIKSLDSSRVSRILYLIEPSEVNVNVKPYDFFPEWNKYKLDTKLKIPLRNPEMVPYSPDDAKLPLCNKGGRRKRCIKVRAKEHKLQIVNSCNGFLCLSEPSQNKPVIVCNPVTGEYLNLPKADESDTTIKDIESCGFGFCEETRKYKVIRMFNRGDTERFDCPITGKKVFKNRVAEIHTLGTGSCRRLSYAPYYFMKLKFPTYLNGALHWISIEGTRFDLIYSFDLAKEQFRSIQPPPFSYARIDCLVQLHISLGVLRGRLYVSIASTDDIEIWVMEKYGEQKTWKNLVSIAMFCGESLPDGLYQPLDFLQNKCLLMFQSPKSAFIFYKKKYVTWNYFRIQDTKGKFEVVAHIPSLISLRDAVMGDNAEILNINSGCNQCKLLGETKSLFLVEVCRELETDTDKSSSSYYEE